MTAYVDPQHIEVITAAAREEIRENCGCGFVSYGPDNLRDVQCFPHLVLGLLQPSVEAHERPF